MSFSDFLILPGFIDFTSDEVVSAVMCVLNIKTHFLEQKVLRSQFFHQEMDALYCHVSTSK